MTEDVSVDRVVAQLEALLVPGEKLEAWAVQRRLFALVHRRMVIGATSGRLISLSRGLLGGYQPVDVRWQDLKNANLSVGIFGAELRIECFTGGDLAMSGQPRSFVVGGLRKEEAREVYRFCQAQEQAWREKRRIRELEEMRARSGGINLAQGGSSPLSPGGAGADPDPVSRLEKAKEMLDKGLITDSEYESLKARIVSGL